jgi:uncharacterized radical SAM protein YgiQ
MTATFLPTTPDEMKERGWDSLDVVLVSGDAYVDHPSYGTAVIGRVLERAGFRVGVIAQPDWRSTTDFLRLGRPRLFFGISAGNVDSMVANYTARKKPRLSDDYSPAGEQGLRPDRATIVYANRIREAHKDAIIVIGGTEASLRRFAHYDWWDNAVRRSILLDSRADILIYGMGEKQVTEIARRLAEGVPLTGIAGTAVIVSSLNQFQGLLEIPSYEEVKSSRHRFNEALMAICANQDHARGRILAQRHGPRYVLQFPPPPPITPVDLDRIYELPYMRAWHPAYDRNGGVPGFETVRFSLISHRGCCGECSFCGLSMHQGRIVQSRTRSSILREARTLAERPEFKGTITDVGGATANLYGAACPFWIEKGACSARYCLTPEPCRYLKPGYDRARELLTAVKALPGVKHVFIESGLRYDLLTTTAADPYMETLCREHVGGQLKVAPEHSSEAVLRLMNKPPFARYEEFREKFRLLNKRLGKDQHLVNYFISAHPGDTLEETLKLSLYLLDQHIYPEQIQDFMPLPMTVSGAMYYTGMDPYSGRDVHVAKTFRERKMHRALIQYRHPANIPYLKEALKLLKREDLMDLFFREARIRSRGTERKEGNERLDEQNTGKDRKYGRRKDGKPRR